MTRSQSDYMRSGPKNASYKITYKLNGGKNHASNPKTYTIESQIKLKNQPVQAIILLDGTKTVNIKQRSAP